MSQLQSDHTSHLRPSKPCSNSDFVYPTFVQLDFEDEAESDEEENSESESDEQFADALEKLTVA